MVFTHRITDDTRTFTVRLVRSVVQLDHGIEDTPLHRLQTISYIRQCTLCNDTHGIVDVGTFHCFLQIHIMYLVKNLVIHRIFLHFYQLHHTLYSPSVRYQDSVHTLHFPR